MFKKQVGKILPTYFNHALLTEKKDSVNGTGLGFTVWGEAVSSLHGHDKPWNCQLKQFG